MRLRSIVAVSALIPLTLIGCSTPSPRAVATARSSTDANESAPRRHAGPGPVQPGATLTAQATAAGGSKIAMPSAPIAAKPSAKSAVAEDEGAARNTEGYHDYGVNPAVDPNQDRLSTFAIDVDTASYAIARRKLVDGGLPPVAAVRIEEFLNAFDYDYEGPSRGPFAVHLDGAPSPLAAGHHLLRIGVQGKRLAPSDRKPVHLVYLVDTSGSMMSEDKIGLAKKSLRLLTGSLKKGDTVALCTYAGSVREVLKPTGIEDKAAILRAIDDLTASGSTAMASGIELAYGLAERSRVPGEVNRVVVLSDGDANVGPTSHEEILRRIAHFKGEGITLSTVGFGQGTYKDEMMEQLADKGDGNYAYIDTEDEARKVFAKNVDGMLEVIARDVKIQVDFDPSVVKEYRLLGYENRDVADRDFRNDAVDGGEIGAGHSVTALYDVILKRTDASPLTVRIRHKQPVGGSAEESAFPMRPASLAPSFAAAPRSLQFATAVAGFAEVLRKSPRANATSLEELARIAETASGDRPERLELVGLVRKAERLAGGGSSKSVAAAP